MLNQTTPIVRHLTGLRGGLSLSAVLLAASVAGTASAASVTAKATSNTSGSYTMHYNEGSGGVNFDTSGGAGLFEWQVTASGDKDQLALHGDNDNKFYTFCIEVVETLRMNTSYTYELTQPLLAPSENGDLQRPMGPTAAGLLSKWYGTYYNDMIASDSIDQERAFQMGVWEIVYESIAIERNFNPLQLTGDFNINNGVFTTSADSGNTLAQSWLDSNWQTDGKETVLIALTKDGKQDQIAVAAPEFQSVPSPVAFIPGAAGMLFLASRRRRRTAD
jgi:hypothetical protein